MAPRTRGRHQTTDKEGKSTLASLRAISGVTTVIIGRSIGGKSVGRTGRAGTFKLQREVPGGFKGLLQSSRGVQEIFVQVVEEKKAEVEKAIKEKFG